MFWTIPLKSLCTGIEGITINHLPKFEKGPIKYCTSFNPSLDRAGEGCAGLSTSLSIDCKPFT
jgi:hypothetical protein